MSLCRLSRPPSRLACQTVRFASSTAKPADSRTSIPSPQPPSRSPSQPPPPPDLNRPLGFPYAPKKAEPLPTLMQRTKSLLTTPNKYKEIMAEEGGSYWADFNAMRVNDGKQWIAPKNLFREDKSLYFPNLAGQSLAAEEAELLPLFGRPTLIRLFSATSGEEHVHGLGEGLGLQLIDVNIQTNVLKYGLLKMFLGRIKGLIEPERHDKYFILRGGWERKLKVIGAINAYVGYAYLLDKSGKIRWASCGALTETERGSLTRVTQRLLQLNQ